MKSSQSEAMPQPSHYLRRPMTPILELEEETTPTPTATEHTCSFDADYCVTAPDPQHIQDHVTSNCTDRASKIPTNHLAEIKQLVKEIKDGSMVEHGSCSLDMLCDLYTSTRHAIDTLEEELLTTKRCLELASNQFQSSHERVTSARSRHRMTKGLREVTEEKAVLWREHCRNLELGYAQERPELEQLKIVLSILKSGVTDLTESNKYLLSFVDVLKKKRIKEYEFRYLAQIKNHPKMMDGKILREHFDNAIKNQMNLRSIKKPRGKPVDYRELIKTLGHNMPRPPFGPINVFKLKAMSPLFGKSSLQYGHGQVCTLKVNIAKDMFGDEGTYGRVTPDAKETWVLAGRKCLKGDQEQTTRPSFGNLVMDGNLLGFPKLPSIGSRSMEQCSSWSPKRSVVRKGLVGFGGQKVTRSAGHAHQWRKSKRTESGISLNKWGDSGDHDAEVFGKGEMGSFKIIDTNSTQDVNTGQESLANEGDWG